MLILFKGISCIPAGNEMQVFGLLDMQEQVETALAKLALSLEGTPAATFLADFTQLDAMLRQEVPALTVMPPTVRYLAI